MYIYISHTFNALTSSMSHIGIGLTDRGNGWYRQIQYWHSSMEVIKFIYYNIIIYIKYHLYIMLSANLTTECVGASTCHLLLKINVSYVRSII